MHSSLHILEDIAASEAAETAGAPAACEPRPVAVYIAPLYTSKHMYACTYNTYAWIAWAQFAMPGTATCAEGAVDAGDWGGSPELTAACSFLILSILAS